MLAKERLSGSFWPARDARSAMIAAGVAALVGLAVLSACARPSVHHVATPDEVASACAGVPDVERDHPSMLQRPELEGVRESMGEQRYIKFSRQELRGAELLVRPTPGVSRQWIARVIRCHVAYSDLPGAAAPRIMPDPLLVDEANVTFDETETAFVIRIQGTNKTEGEEILARAQRLVAP
jgi:hypothetical protein